MSTLQLDATGLITTCPKCGQRNRVTFGAREARCGKCKTELPPAAEPIEVPDETSFDALIQNAAHPVVVDFWAPWCGPCRMVAPEIARVASANAGRLVVAKVNTDDVPELGERFGIRSIPTMFVFDRGREAARTSGAMPAAQIEAFVRGAVPGRF
jgi:thioredoxin 2